MNNVLEKMNERVKLLNEQARISNEIKRTKDKIKSSESKTPPLPPKEPATLSDGIKDWAHLVGVGLLASIVILPILLIITAIVGPFIGHYGLYHSVAGVYFKGFMIVYLVLLIRIIIDYINKNPQKKYREDMEQYNENLKKFERKKEDFKTSELVNRHSDLVAKANAMQSKIEKNNNEIVNLLSVMDNDFVDFYKNNSDDTVDPSDIEWTHYLVSRWNKSKGKINKIQSFKGNLERYKSEDALYKHVMDEYNDRKRRIEEKEREEASFVEFCNTHPEYIEMLRMKQQMKDMEQQMRWERHDLEREQESYDNEMRQLREKQEREDRQRRQREFFDEIHRKDHQRHVADLRTRANSAANMLRMYQGQPNPSQFDIAKAQEQYNKAQSDLLAAIANKDSIF